VNEKNESDATNEPKEVESLVKQILTDRSILRKSSIDAKVNPDGTLHDDTKKTISHLIASIPTDALGLSAPQIGIFEKIFIARIPIDDYVEQKSFVFVNPSLEMSDNLFFSTEACLSLPRVEKCVRRSIYVKVKGLIYPIQNSEVDDSTMVSEMEFVDKSAAVIQHENDHLNGVLLVDHIDASGSDEVIKRIMDRRERVNKNRENQHARELKDKQIKHRKINPKAANKQKKMYKTYEKLVKRKIENSEYRKMLANGTIVEDTAIETVENKSCSTD